MLASKINSIKMCCKAAPQRSAPWVGLRTHKNTIFLVSWLGPSFKFWLKICRLVKGIHPWDSSQVSRENYTQKYDLIKVPTAGTFVNWPPDSGKLRSKVWNDQGTCSMYLCEFPLWLEKTTLKSMIWPVCPQRAHQGFSLLVGMKTKRF